MQASCFVTGAAVTRHNLHMPSCLWAARPGLILLIAIAIGGSAAAADLPPLGEPIHLFNGRDLSRFDTFLRDKGFNNDPDQVFRVHDGVVHVSGKEYGYFITN